MCLVASTQQKFMNIWESNEDLDFETIGVDMDHVNKEATTVKISRLNITKLFSTPTIVTIVKATTHETREIAWELLFFKLSVNQKN